MLHLTRLTLSAAGPFNSTLPGPARLTGSRFRVSEELWGLQVCPPGPDRCPLPSLRSVASTQSLSWCPRTRQGLRTSLPPIISSNTRAEEAPTHSASERSVRAPGWPWMGLSAGLRSRGQRRQGSCRPSLWGCFSRGKQATLGDI